MTRNYRRQIWMRYVGEHLNLVNVRILEVTVDVIYAMSGCEEVMHRARPRITKQKVTRQGRII
jgi:hypothetical protein